MPPMQQIRSDRATKLECLRLASTMASQGRSGGTPVLDLAKQFFEWVKADPPDDNAGAHQPRPSSMIGERW